MKDKGDDNFMIGIKEGMVVPTDCRDPESPGPCIKEDCNFWDSEDGCTWCPTCPECGDDVQTVEHPYDENMWACYVCGHEWARESIYRGE